MLKLITVNSIPVLFVIQAPDGKFCNHHAKCLLIGEANVNNLADLSAALKEPLRIVNKHLVQQIRINTLIFQQSEDRFL